MQLYQKQATFSKNLSSLINYISNSGFLVTMGEAWRTPEQALLYAKQGKGIVDSLHCKRLAIDINLLNSEGTYLTDYSHYKQFGEYWKSLHYANRWGGDFPKLVDANHFEMQDI